MPAELARSHLVLACLESVSIVVVSFRSEALQDARRYLVFKTRLKILHFERRNSLLTGGWNRSVCSRWCRYALTWAWCWCAFEVLALQTYCFVKKFLRRVKQFQEDVIEKSEDIEFQLTSRWSWYALTWGRNGNRGSRILRGRWAGRSNGDSGFLLSALKRSCSQYRTRQLSQDR